jgi:transglutaminase-like putative cysteine protease
MQYKVSHVTKYTYDNRVPIGYNRVCLTPRRCPYQECLRATLDVQPVPAVFSQQTRDYYGNEVLFFTVQDPHDTLTITALSEVRLNPVLSPMPESTPSWETVRDTLRYQRTPDVLDAYQFAFDIEQPIVSEALRRYAEVSFSKGTPVLSGAIDLMHRIFEEFTYDPQATTVSTPIEEVLETRRGVCQDFAHVQIGCLRALGLAARYVSGYIAPVRAGSDAEFVGSQASHAWLSIFVPGHGWVDLDPTNDVLPSIEHITLGWGRDYDEVCPVAGVILGGGGQHLSVSVQVTRIAAA